jgi:anthranilate synthase/aminodeoxychorismate synthase-like glutamine amidotransferase
MLLMIDNYDSFTYNLVQYFEILGQEVVVFRNDQITAKAIIKLNPQYIVISPGPATPQKAGNCLLIIKELYKHFPILGVCLGHQAIGEAFGGNIIHAPYLMHGKISQIEHDPHTIFRNIPSPFPAARYHSLIVEKVSLPKELEISAWTADGLIMGLRHRHYPIEGVQFHPESIATQPGLALLENFLKQ